MVWLWRLQASRRGQWPYGKEFPAVELASVFAAAGLRVLGERVVGASWAERFLLNLKGVDPELLSDMLALHRSPILGDDAKGYLLATLAAVPDAVTTPADDWSAGAPPSGQNEAVLTGALADALSMQLAAQSKLRVAEGQREDRAAARIEALVVERERLHQEVAKLQASVHGITARLSDETARSTTATKELHAHGQELTQVRAARDSLAQRAQELAAKMDEMQRWIDQVRSSRTFRLLRSMDRLRGRPRA